MKRIMIIAVVIIGLLATLAIVGLASLSLTPFQQLSLESSNSTTTPQPSENPRSNSPPPTSSNSPYVEVNYHTVGWFYSLSGDNLYDSSYNYTYLVLNVTITNHGYSQVNVIGTNGFSVLTNGNNYTPTISNPAGLYNGSISSFYGMKSSFSFDSKLPSQAILLDTGNVNGILSFKLGDPNVYPQQPQILNESFTLQYSVSYGDSVPLWERQVYQLGPYATVVINQK